MMDWWKENTSQDSGPVTVGAVSDPGVVHDENEDAYGNFSPQGVPERLCVVADGMGGHERGQVASRTAVAVVKKTFFGDRESSVLERLRRAFHRANDRVYESAENHEREALMGATTTAVALVEGDAYVAHVGDSRAYRFRANESQQLTRDHTVARKMQRQGVLTAEEVRRHPRRGTLTRAIGVDSTVEVDLKEAGPFQPGDHLLLCTDGIEDLSEKVLREVVLDNAPQRACEQLVQRANDRGGHDNATALVVHRARS